MNRSTLVYALMFSLTVNVAAAVAVASTLWRREARAEISSYGSKPIAKFVQEDLNLDAKVTVQILALLDRTRSEVDQLRGVMSSRRSEMIRLVAAGQTEKEALTAKVDEITLIHGQVRKKTVLTLLTISESLDHQRRERFGKYLEERAAACGHGGRGSGRWPLWDLRGER
jgi:Spy/CpxP family protein refolding chaperone